MLPNRNHALAGRMARAAQPLGILIMTSLAALPAWGSETPCCPDGWEKVATYSPPATCWPFTPTQGTKEPIILYRNGADVTNQYLTVCQGETVLISGEGGEDSDVCVHPQNACQFSSKPVLSVFDWTGLRIVSRAAGVPKSPFLRPHRAGGDPLLPVRPLVRWRGLSLVSGLSGNRSVRLPRWAESGLLRNSEVVVRSGQGAIHGACGHGPRSGPAGWCESLCVSSVV